MLIILTIKIINANLKMYGLWNCMTSCSQLKCVGLKLYILMFYIKEKNVFITDRNVWRKQRLKEITYRGHLAYSKHTPLYIMQTRRMRPLRTYEIFPKGANAALMSSVVISGLKSPTKTWKWSAEKIKSELLLNVKDNLLFNLWNAWNTVSMSKPLLIWWA